MITYLMLQAIALQFRFMECMPPFPFAWYSAEKKLKFRKLTLRLIPWYWTNFVFIPTIAVICGGLLVYEIVHPERTLNFIQILVSIVVTVASVISTIVAATLTYYADELVSNFREIFELEKTLSKGKFS
jgi:hypothetical protein